MLFINNKIVILLLFIAIKLSGCEPRRTNVGVDVGNIFRLGFVNNHRGTGLGINVLDGFVRVGVDRDRYRPVHIDYDDDYRPVRKRNKIKNVYRRGSTDVRVSVG